MRSTGIHVRNHLLAVLLLLGGGCCSRNIQILDENSGKPVPDVLVAAYQQNIFFHNSKQLFKTDENGKIVIPFSGLVDIYAGKKGYDIANAVTDTDAKILLSKTGKKNRSIANASYLTSGIYQAPPEGLWKEWTDYIKESGTEHK